MPPLRAGSSVSRRDARVGWVERSETHRRNGQGSLSFLQPRITRKKRNKKRPPEPKFPFNRWVSLRSTHPTATQNSLPYVVAFSWHGRLAHGGMERTFASRNAKALGMLPEARVYPEGIPSISPGLRYSATLGWIAVPNLVYPNGVAFRTGVGRNPFRVKRGGVGVFSQGSGVPQPWASSLNPVGILGDTGQVGNG